MSEKAEDAVTAANLGDSRETLQWIVQWGYDHGIHELGYDPIQAFEDAVRASERGVL